MMSFIIRAICLIFKFLLTTVLRLLRWVFKIVTAVGACITRCILVVASCTGILLFARLMRRVAHLCQEADLLLFAGVGLALFFGHDPADHEFYKLLGAYASMYVGLINGTSVEGEAYILVTLFHIFKHLKGLHLRPQNSMLIIILILFDAICAFAIFVSSSTLNLRFCIIFNFACRVGIIVGPRVKLENFVYLVTSIAILFVFAETLFL